MKYLKYGLLTLLLLVVLFVLYLALFVHESRPTIVDNVDVNAKKAQIFKAVDKPAWDTLSYIKWNFAGRHSFVWDRINNDALVKWEDYTVHLDPDEVRGVAYKGDAKIEGDEATKLVQDAWSYWCNDMFWLSAPYKIEDKGTKLAWAKDSEDKEGLLVTYNSGGVTPGDSYLWFFDENGTPTGYKMWVDIIPIGGVYFSWDEWKKLEGGAKVSTLHKGIMDINITDLAAGDEWKDLGFSSSPIKL